MPIPRTAKPRTKPPEERRRELMDAAEQLFLKHGVAATTVEQITQRAAVAKGTFYLYFYSKEAVLTALESRFSHDLLAKISSALADTPKHDWKRKLSAWADAAIAGELDSSDLHEILFSGSRMPAHKGMVDRNIIIEHLAELLRGGQHAGAWSLDDVRLTAVFLFCGMHGIVDEARLRSARAHHERLTRALQNLCFRAVGLAP